MRLCVLFEPISEGPYNIPPPNVSEGTFCSLSPKEREEEFILDPQLAAASIFQEEKVGLIEIFDSLLFSVYWCLSRVSTNPA